MIMARDRMATTVDTFNEVRQRSRATLADRVRRVRAAALFAAQAGVAAGLSWVVAFDLLHHTRPFFAPIAAVIALNVSVGQRLRRVVELVVGVALGILVGDALIYFTRFLDALIGGVVGILVMALLLPVNPSAVIRRAAGPAMDLLADGLRGCAAALAPVFWRSRGPLTQYLDAAEHIEHAARNGRVLARRTVALLRDGEPAPPGLVEALQILADAVTALRDALAATAEPLRPRELTLVAVGRAADVYRAGLGFSGDVVVAQIRTIGTDLLLASGLPRPVVEKAIRRAVGRLPNR